MAEELVLNTDFNITKAEAKINKLNRQFEESKRKAKEIAAKIGDLEEKKKSINFTVNIEQKSFDNAVAKLERLESQKLSIPLDDTTAQNAIDDEIEKARAATDKYARALENAKTKQADINQELQKQNGLLTKQNGQTATIKENIALAKQEQTKFGEEIKKSAKETKKSLSPLQVFTNRVIGLAKRVFIFSAITSALRKMRDALSGYIAQDSKLSSSVSKLKGNLSTIGATISSAISPALTVVVDKLVKVTNLVGATLARMLGKDVKKMQELAASTKKTGEEAKKATASFDTLQKAENTESDSDSAAGLSNTSGMGEVDLSAYPLLNAIASINLTPLITALNSLKAIDLTPLKKSASKLLTALEPFKDLALDGLKFLWFEILVPLSEWTIEDLLPAFLDLLTAALEALAPILEAMKPTLKKIWDKILKPFAEWLGDKVIELLKWLTDKLTAFSDWAKKNPQKVERMTDIIISFLAGLWVYNSSKKIVGFIGDLTSSLKKFGGLKGMLNKLGDSINSPALALGVLASAATYWVENWDEIKDSFNNMDTWQQAVVIILGVAAAIAVLITALSAGAGAAAIVAGLAALGLGAGILAIGDENKAKGKGGTASKSGGSSGSSGGGVRSIANGKKSANATLSSLKIGDYDLPKLATGAVLPGGSPMLAWVNDQPKGKGYIEGSVENIAAAFEKYLSNHDLDNNKTFVIEADGDMGALIRLLNLKIKEQNRLSGVMT